MSQHAPLIPVLKIHDGRYPENAEFFGIEQDAEQNIWIGSDNGVYRYDGSYFEKVISRGELGSGLITRVYPDFGGSMFLVGEHPRGYYILCNDTFKVANKTMGTVVNGIRTVYDKENGRIWQYLPVLNRLRCDHRDGHIERIEPPELSIGRLDIVMGMVYLLRQSKGYYVFRNDAFELLGLEVSAPFLNMLEGPDGKVWAISKTYILRLNDDGEWREVVEHLLGEQLDHTNSAVWDREGRLWISGRNEGLFIYDQRSHLVNSVDHQVDIEHAKVTGLYCDNVGNVWISTMNQGVRMAVASRFLNYPVVDGKEESYVTALYKSLDGSLWVGTNSGAYQVLLNHSGKPSGRGHFVDNTYIKAFTESVNGKLIIAYSGVNQQQHRVDGNHEYFSENAASLTQTGDGSIVVGAWNNFSVMGSPNSFDRSLQRLNACSTLGTVLDYFEWKDRPFVLTESGLFRFENDELIAFSENINSKSQTIEYKAQEMDNEGCLWLATSEGVFKSLFAESGELRDAVLISDAVCSSLAKDNDGNIWGATNSGLLKFDSAAPFCYNLSSGLADARINKLLFDESFNCLWVGTKSGITQVFVDSIDQGRTGPIEVSISAMEALRNGVFSADSSRSFAHNQNQFRIKLAALGERAPGNVQFQYRLNDANAQWTTLKGNQVELADLDPGEYTFYARARQSSGAFGPESELSFSISPALWNRWVFWLGILVWSTDLVFLIVGWTQSKDRQMALKLRKKDSAIKQFQHQALRANMNPHFIFNSLNSIQHFLVKYNDPLATEYVADFARLIRENMDAINEIVTTVAGEVERLAHYIDLEVSRLDGKLSYELSIDQRIDPTAYKLPTMLIQPFVENAIWHGIAPKEGDGHLVIRLELIEEEALRITVRDNGVGIHSGRPSKMKDHHSMGIDLIRERLAMLSESNSLKIEELSDENGHAVGTVVEILLFPENAL